MDMIENYKKLALKSLKVVKIYKTWYNGFKCIQKLLHVFIIAIFWRMNKNVRLIIVISRKAAYRYVYQISVCEVLILWYSGSPIICINKTLAIIYKIYSIRVTSNCITYWFPTPPCWILLWWSTNRELFINDRIIHIVIYNTMWLRI